jgi:GR25 family glycosyltransferase involved in LPS biosynthesis
MSIVNRVVDKVYVINMDSQTERLKTIDSTLRHHGIEYERFSAVRGAAITTHEWLTPACNQFCADAMKGCALSHRSIWEQIVKKHYSSVLILEDDINLDAVMFETFRNAWNSLPKDFDIVWLGCHTVVEDNTPFAKALTGVLGRTSNNINEHIVESSCGFGAYGYIISRRCAEKFLELQIPFHIDYTMSGWISTYGLKSYVMRELPVRPNVDMHAQSTLSEQYPKGLNSILKNIPASNQTKMDWALGETFAKVWGQSINYLFLLIVFLSIFIPRQHYFILFIWLGLEFLLSFDLKSTLKFGVPLGFIYVCKLALYRPFWKSIRSFINHQ